MERLTERNENGKKEAYYPYCFREDTCDGDGPSEKCVACALSTKICEKLAEYEDTGLTPDEIREMQELLSRENGKETTRFSRDNDVTEYCPHCDREITVSWNVEQDGYQIYCPNCGETIMLCSRCDREPCDWTENGCKYSDDRYGKRKDGRRKYEADT